MTITATSNHNNPTKKPDFASLAAAGSLGNLLSGTTATTTTTTTGLVQPPSRQRTLEELKVVSSKLDSSNRRETSSSFSNDISARMSNPYLEHLTTKMRASHGLQSRSGGGGTTGTTLAAGRGGGGVGGFRGAGVVEEQQQQLPQTLFRTAEQRCDDHFRRIANGILQQEQRQTRERLDARSEERHVASHEALIHEVLSEVHGGRTLGGSSLGQRPLLEAGATAAAPFRGTTRTTTTPMTTTTTTTRDERLDRQKRKLLVDAYLDIVRHWNRNYQKVSLSQVVQAFSSIPSSSTSSHSSSLEVWQLLDKILEDPTTGGALAHYCLQFQEIVKQRVRNAHAAGQDVSIHSTLFPQRLSNGMAQTVAAHVQLTLRPNTASSFLWATMYGCLRCGDAVAALHVLDRAAAGGNDNIHNKEELNAIRQILAEWSDIQRDAPVFVHGGSHRRMVASTSAAPRQTMTDLYTRAVHSSTSTSSSNHDDYYVATLGLLSLQEDEPTMLSSPVVQTMEDYMYMWLWYAAQAPSSSSSSSPSTRLVELADALTALGPSHFPDSEWGYALPLLAAQQYAKALQHLMECSSGNGSSSSSSSRKNNGSGTCHAVHVALVLHQAGLLQEENDEDASAVYAHRDPDTDLLTWILLEYTRQLLQQQQQDKAMLVMMSPPEAVEYLIRIPNEKRRATEIARLGVESRMLEQFPLQELCSQEGIALVLVEASQFARDKGDADLAARLLFQSGNYDALLSFLNDVLSAEILKQSHDRKWRNQSKDFRKDFLVDSQNSPVLRSLQSRGQQGQLSTFRLLLDMSDFLDLASSEQFGRAVEQMDEFPLFPLTEDDCPAKIRQYLGLDPAVKRVFPLMLEVAMQSLVSVFGRLKASGYDRASSTSEQERLRNKARLLLYSFATMLKAEIPRDVMDRMTRLERGMM